MKDRQGRERRKAGCREGWREDGREGREEGGREGRRAGGSHFQSPFSLEVKRWGWETPTETSNLFHRSARSLRQEESLQCTL